MRLKVRFTPCGREQFLSAVGYIHRNNPEAAIQFRNKVEKTLRRLEQYPESGRIIPEFPDLAFREIIVSPYRFFYRTSTKAVWIVAAWHSAQVPRAPLDFED